MYQMRPVVPLVESVVHSKYIFIKQIKTNVSLDKSFLWYAHLVLGTFQTKNNGLHPIYSTFLGRN